ncbi:hypothetical protein [Tenacibaculum maritimum]|uniref:hypothetical protein n=1 Tax=Tenacibaculum maritimum TaxID=107401 RepID=UPI0012E6C6F4|nr:hypothetical protein [Tenacibaculum maritimum]CAA0192790.1 conserved hypothetical protein [Tenacibaculum maritimum]
MKNFTDLKTFEDACKVEKLNPKTVIPDFSCYPEADRKSMEAHAKLVIIVRAANRLANDGKQWIPDFTNFDECKYEAWFDLEENGSSGFRFLDYDCWSSGSLVGSRLCFISREVCKYIGKQFLDTYKEYFM